ncbi:MAG: serine/threonine protein kinase [Planctomycetota bacterium]|jgi:serine/threonine-protein kinase
MPFLDQLKSLFSGTKVDVSKRFALLRAAISGTMSKFYMARDLNTEEVVGLKILDPEKLAAFEARFKGLTKPCEGEIAFQMKHPHIVETREFGLTTEGAQYLIMEFLEGAGMNSLLVARDERLETYRLEFIRQTAEALAAVHAAGFIHRDVCPRNLMLTGDGENVKLIDFGLSVPATSPFMLPGNRTGTPNYMAPELVRRRSTDQRLDIFAFGVTAYEMCTYELPWIRGSTGMAAMGHDQPPIDVRKFRPQINPRLADAIHSCIEPNAEKRCQSMEKLLQMIRRVESTDAP